MEIKKRDIVNLLGTGFIVVFFLLLGAAYANKPTRHLNNTSEYELAASIHFNSSKAVVANAVSCSTFKIFVTNLPNSFFNSDNNTRAYNNIINQNFRLLQSDGKKIKLFIKNRFYYQLFANDGEDVPIFTQITHWRNLPEGSDERSCQTLIEAS